MASFAKVKKLIAGDFLETNLLKADDYLVVSDAAGVLEEAKQDAKKIILEAKQSAKAIEEEAFETGLKRSQVVQAARIVQLEKEHRIQLSQIESRVPGLVYKVVESLLGSMPVDELVGRMVTEAIARENFAEALVVKVHPESMGSVTRALSALQVTDLNVKVVEEKSFSQDQCTIETGYGCLDLGLKAFTQRLGEILGLPAGEA